jgi:hypothetical protein
MKNGQIREQTARLKLRLRMPSKRTPDSEGLDHVSMISLWDDQGTCDLLNYIAYQANKQPGSLSYELLHSIHC